MKENKTGDKYGIPAKIWKYGGLKMQEKLFDAIKDVWEKTKKCWKTEKIKTSCQYSRKLYKGTVETIVEHPSRL